ncbi:hypothetical protein RIF29_23995 [Crotalaria pallida]|uniref:Uncharacterized protein n=1 Tax=Crotalaria pallida TaxID=3830 RepID=A0AAN9EP35_CROPI
MQTITVKTEGPKASKRECSTVCVDGDSGENAIPVKPTQFELALVAVGSQVLPGAVGCVAKESAGVDVAAGEGGEDREGDAPWKRRFMVMVLGFYLLVRNEELLKLR